ncbi:hypothetical protein [Erythrobacter sp. YT30]|uniref:hypothetical protein n=1 Tax=Erythrobacter sp. YT30 TaxID=1735012 RepID=UPI0012E3EFB8|nr:hypothetical protein [Erythrobacter sp. YT30]
MTNTVKKMRFIAPSDAGTNIWLEPWCWEYEMPAGRELVVTYEPPPDREDCTSVSTYSDGIVLWCEGDNCKVWREGTEITL